MRSQALTPTQNRLQTLDTLRGVAVVLMMQQHLVYWMWDREGENMRHLMSRYPLTVVFNGLGGLAAPLFTVLAGVSAMFLWKKTAPKSVVPVFLTRGLFIMAMGYILNILTPSWFSPGSWYILHVIGFSLCITPAVLKIPRPFYPILIVLFVFLAYAMQQHLHTPSFLSNKRMGDITVTGGVFRLAFFEGHFPIFPWLGFFLSGMYAHHLYTHHSPIRQFLFPTSVLLLSVLLAGLGALLQSPEPAIQKLTGIRAILYPLNPVPAFALIAAAVLLCLLALHRWFFTTPLLRAMGHASLSILLFHVIVFREGSIRLDLHQLLPHNQAVLFVIAVIGGTAVLVLFWRKAGMKYGLEWLMRILAKKAASRRESANPKI